MEDVLSVSNERGEPPRCLACSNAFAYPQDWHSAQPTNRFAKPGAACEFCHQLNCTETHAQAFEDMVQRVSYEATILQEQEAAFQTACKLKKAQADEEYEKALALLKEKRDNTHEQCDEELLENINTKCAPFRDDLQKTRERLQRMRQASALPNLQPLILHTLRDMQQHASGKHKMSEHIVLTNPKPWSLFSMKGRLRRLVVKEDTLLTSIFADFYMLSNNQLMGFISHFTSTPTKMILDADFNMISSTPIPNALLMCFDRQGNIVMTVNRLQECTYWDKNVNIRACDYKLCMLSTNEDYILYVSYNPSTHTVWLLPKHGDATDVTGLFRGITEFPNKISALHGNKFWVSEHLIFDRATRQKTDTGTLVRGQLFPIGTDQYLCLYDSITLLNDKFKVIEDLGIDTRNVFVRMSVSPEGSFVIRYVNKPHIHPIRRHQFVKFFFG